MRFVRQNRWSRNSVVLTCVAIAIVLTTLAPHQEAFADDNELAAVYHRGSLEVIVPHDEGTTRNKVLVLEIVDPNDKLVAKAVRYASPDNRASKVTIPLDDSLKIEDIAWDRLKVRVGDSSKIISLSEILRVPVVRVFAQRAYAAGSPASVRIITADSRSGNPLRDTRVKLELMNGDSATTLFTGRTDGFGTAQVAFTLPVDNFGSRRLRVTADTTLGTVTANQPIQLERRDRILLTTDKPLYQPGQTIHLRALALDGPTHAAVADKPIVLEVEDGKGNKVFKKRDRTDRFGVASADFELADEVNFGPYHIRAILGEAEAASTQEKTVTVERYVLPKFKVEVELSGDAAKQQASYYAPGETIKGAITARYLFGKPLTNAEVNVTLTTFDVQSVELGKLIGKTDAEGHFPFSYKLPDFFAGRSTQQGSAPVSIGVEVKDTAQHTETKSRNVLVAKTPILIMAVPESGRLLPGLENRVYILTSTPDGSPVQTTVTGNINPARIQTDASGVAIVSISAGNEPAVLKLTAVDARGRSAQSDVKLESVAQSQSLMIRTNQAVYKVGDTIRLETISTRQRGAVYIDVVKDGQTLITRAIDTAGGRGGLSLDLTPSMFGTLEIRAYQITSDADPISDRRLVYVDPADDLKVEVSAERESYKPGDEACVNFRVTDRMGRPVSAALGIEIVDEAVFALSDKQPGFEKVFMYLEKELLTPRYEVHQFSFEKVLLDDFEGEKPLAQRERAARVLLAAASSVSDKDVRGEYGREAIQAKRGDYLAQYAVRLNEKAQAIARAMTSYYENHAASPAGFKRDLESFASDGAAERKTLEDPWGNPLIGDGQFTASDNSYLTLRSMGPDGREKTADDIGFQVYAQRKPQANANRYGQFKGRATVDDDKIAGGRVAIEGTVREKSAAIAGVKVSARRVANGATTSVYTDANGRFTIPNLAPGSYHIVFESQPHQPTIYRTLILNAGARGVVEVTLESRVSTPVMLTAYLDYNGEFGRAINGRAGGKMMMMDRMAMRKDGAVNVVAEMAAVVPAPMAQPKAMLAGADEERDNKQDAGGPRVRSFFPETLYTNPSLITDGQGRASIHVPMA
ncbi:MAG TPA: MG2 domain-containing protein, partial [Blastocatellia bacterium]|nr:MG2 domain-containing protein [Blastocatellia bacterium]